MAKTKKVSTISKSRKPAAKAKSRKSTATSRPVKPEVKTKNGKAESGKAIRLTFSYDGAAVKLLSKERVEMIVPPSDPLKGFGRQTGFWAELRDKQDKTLYRQVLHNPTRNDAEVFPDPDENPEQSISREPAPKRKGVFIVLVPDMVEGDSLTMCRSPLETKGPARGIRSLSSKPATKFKRIKLKK